MFFGVGWNAEHFRGDDSSSTLAHGEHSAVHDGWHSNSPSADVAAAARGNDRATVTQFHRAVLGRSSESVRAFVGGVIVSMCKKEKQAAIRAACFLNRVSYFALGKTKYDILEFFSYTLCA